MDQIDPKASTSQIEDSSVIRPDTYKEFGSLPGLSNVGAPDFESTKPPVGDKYPNSKLKEPWGTLVAQALCFKKILNRMKTCLFLAVMLIMNTWKKTWLTENFLTHCPESNSPL